MLRTEIELALEEAAFLVVLCTPRAAQSRWVQLEIEAFKAAGKRASIIPVLAGGSPVVYDSEHAPNGAFPKELFDQDMTLTNMPLAPDFRDVLVAGEEAEAKFQDGFLRLVAKFLDVPFPELTQRQRVFEQAQLRKRNRVIAALAVLLGLAVAGGTAAWLQKNAADKRLAQALDSAARQVEIAWRSRDRYRVPTSFRQEMFEGASEDFTAILEYSGGNPALLLNRARYHLGMFDLGRDVSGSPLSADDHLQGAQSDLDAAQGQLQKWYAPIVYPHAPDPGALLRARVAYLDRAARVAVHDQRGDEAKGLSLEAAALADRISKGRPSVDSVYSQCGLADIQYVLNARRSAEDFYSDCLTQTEALFAANSDEAERALRINALIDYGMILRLNRNQVTEALSLHKEAQSLSEPFLDGADSSNDRRLQGISALISLTDTKNLAGVPPADQAKAYIRARDKLEQLITSDPTRRDWQLLRAELAYRLAGVQARAALELRDAELLAASEKELETGQSLVAPMLADTIGDDVALRRVESSLDETRAEVMLLRLKGPPVRETVQPIFDLLTEVIAKRKTIVGLTQESKQGARDLANAHLTRARLFHGMPEFSEAITPDLKTARDIFLELSQDADFRPNIFRDLAITDFYAAQFASLSGHEDEACDLARSAERHAHRFLSAFPDEEQVQAEYTTAKTAMTDLCQGRQK